MIALKYIPNSRIANLAAEVKLTWFLCLSIVILFADLILTQLLLLLALLFLAYLGGIRMSNILSFLKLFWPIYLIVFLLHFFYHDGEILFRIWLLEATDQGLKAGLFNLLRFLNFVVVAFCLFSWTSPQEIAANLFSGFNMTKRKFMRELALIFFIAMRFMPVLIREREIVIMAMKARGADFRDGLINKIRLNLRLMLPLFSRVIGQTDDVASALALKGNAGVYFTGSGTRLKAWDYVLILLGFILTVLVIYYE